MVYTEDHVFSSDYYRPLRDLLLKSADVEVCGGQLSSLRAALWCGVSASPQPACHPARPSQACFLPQLRPQSLAVQTF